ncbi:MAG: 4-(cytidine 5'-diphospho)-2-C-methyl-D-erythritol kinase [Crocinitomicaceae bacterium]|nr:4-(cytidine 5'-diphospho)-2-C-methyl-D-erythritol kinase [Crocinitomicaceae bacterium]
MVIYPNAKINIGLAIGDKRPDGYHTIYSNFYPIPLYDILEILPSNEFTFQSSGITIDNDDNLVTRAFELIQARYKIENVFMHLHKQIPLGAGLGGGSADAAFCLKALNEIFKLQLETSTLESLALELGSDCPFFIENKPAHVTGRGEVLSKTTLDLKGKYLKLIYPDIHISTAEAFAHISPKKIPESISDINLTHSVSNDFETWAFQKYPELKALKEQLIQEGAFMTSMSGTGSTIYGVYNEKPVKSTTFHFEKILELE